MHDRLRTLFSLPLIAALSSLAAALRVWNYFDRAPDETPPVDLSGLSVLVPLKGID